MPHQYSDSGYESSSKHISMARQASGSSQPLHSKNGETFKFSIHDQFHVGEYRDARSSISGLESLVDESQTFSSSMDLLPDDNIDPRLSGSNVLAGLADTDLPFDHFSLDDSISRSNLTQTMASKGPHQHDHSLNISEDVSGDPWNLFHVNEPMNKRQRPDHLQSQGMQSKRRNVDEEPEFGSQPVTASRYGSSPSHLVTRQSRSDYQPNQSSPLAGQVQNDFPTQALQQPFQFPAPQSSPYCPVSPENSKLSQGYTPTTPTKPNRTRKQERKHACSDCPNGAKVFTTNNDLIRHKKTVHGMLTPNDRIWICKVEGCQTSLKIWSRLDNFKQHVARMHKDRPIEDAEAMEEVYDPQKHARMEIMKTRNRNSQQNPRRASEQTPMIVADQNAVHDHNNSPNFNRSYGGLPAGHAQTMDRLELHTASTPLSSMNNNPGTTHSTSQSSVVSHRATLNTYGNALAASGMLNVPRASAGQGPLRQRTVPSDRRTIANPETFVRQQQEMHETSSPCLENPYISSSMQDFAALTGGSDDRFETMYAIDAAAHPFSALQSHGTVGCDLGSASSGKSQDLLAKAFTELKESGLPLDVQQRLMGIMAQLQSSAAIDATNTRSGAENSSKKSKADDKEAPKRHRCSTTINVKGKSERCNKAFPTPSELKKHQNRHLRRYGCTFDHCYKRFGTKWEWKRHEHNQHVQQEGWRCSQTINSNGHKLCAQLFYDEESFIEHLLTQHGMNKRDVPKETKDCHLAKKWLGSYWCGFCEKIVRPPPSIAFGRDMDDERYTHVSDHIDGINQQYDMLDWIELGGRGRTKREMKDLDREASLKPDLTQQEAGGDDYSSSEGDPETEATSPEEPGRPHLHVDTAQRERLSSDPGHYDQRRMSSASQPTLQVISPQGDVLMSDMNNQTNNFRQSTQMKDVTMFTEHALSTCQECMKPYCACVSRFPEQPQQQQAYEGNDFDQMYMDSFTNFGTR